MTSLFFYYYYFSHDKTTLLQHWFVTSKLCTQYIDILNYKNFHINFNECKMNVKEKMKTRKSTEKDQ